MRTYQLPQGEFVTLLGDRRLLGQVAGYLDAHAKLRRTGAKDSWTIRLARKPAIRFRDEIECSAFAETFRLAHGKDGEIRLRHSHTPDQIWRLSARSVDIVTPANSRRYHVVQSVYVAARQIGLIAAARNGMTVIHAAAVAAGPASILICGDKGSGKSTLSLALLECGAAYMASDRTIAWGAHGGTLTCGWTGSFRIAPDAIALAVADARAHALMLYMARRKSAANYWYGGKFRFPPRDLLGLCGWSSHQGVKPRLMVELVPAQSGEGAVVPLSRAEVSALWRRHLVSGTLPPFGQWNDLEVPHGLRGIRMQGRTAPQTMAERILKVVERNAS